MTDPETRQDAAAALDDDEPRREVLLAGDAEAGERLDRVIAARLPDLSRAYVQSLIEAGRVRVAGRARKASHRLRAGERVEVVVPPAAAALEAEPLPLAIVYEDADLLVVDKPAGLVVHPAPGHERGTLVNAVLAHAPEVRVNGSTRPGIVHRLDKDTSGLLVVAKHERALAALAAQFQERRTLKEYLALLDGAVEPDEGTIDAPLARDPRNRQRMAVLREGRPAVSHFTVRERFARHTLVAVRIESGRTHQIRVHCAFIGHPVAGDPLYGRGPDAAPGLPLRRQFLHAARLGLTLPSGPWREFTSPLPPDLTATLDALRGTA
jgi:23S rRNA pseudouridine1911/1915/1917 synthase